MTEKEAFWLGTVGIKSQNDDQRKSEVTLVDQEEDKRNKLGQKRKEEGTISASPFPFPFVILLERIELTTVYRGGNGLGERRHRNRF